MLITDHIRKHVREVALAYNASAPAERRINHVSLFGSYAEGRADEQFDVDLLVGFCSPVVTLLTLGRVLDALESALGASADVVQGPMVDGSLLAITKVVPLYAVS